MFNRKNLLVAMSLLLVAAFVLSACQPQVQEVIKTVEVQTTQEVEVIKTVEVQTTVEVVKTVEVVQTPEPTTRKGGWLDNLVMVVDQSADSAVTRVVADDIDIYAYTVANAEVFQTVKDNNLKYVNVYGSSTDLTFNPAGPTFEATGKLNPFSSAAVREAMNMLIDRNYMIQEFLGGLGIARYTAVASSVPDYARFVDVIRPIEAQYAYNPEKADEIISAEMEAMGATKVGDKWQFNGEDVVVIILIRIEDDRRQVGDYVANQLESIGFTVDRQYKSSSEASPLWIFGNMQDGLWHLYTGGWGATGINRDSGYVFQFFFSPNSAYGFSDLWQNYQLDPDVSTAYDRLNNADYASTEERNELFRQALASEGAHSNRIFLYDKLSFVPMNPNVTVAYDLAAGVATGFLMRYTLRFADQEGGEMTFAMPDLLVDPWNPLAGSNWVYDSSPQLATNDEGVVADPYTGLAWPQRIESATVFAEEGLPVDNVLGWVDLQFVPSIEVPADAWSDWDAENQVWITAGERFTETQTAKIKSVVTYPADLYDTVRWHDGSPISPADFVMRMAMQLDAAKEASAIYDASQVGNIESFLQTFYGWKITSTDPLTIEYYTDTWSPDAEINVFPVWPDYQYGDGAWHMMAIGYLADAAGELAFSADKGEELEVDWMSYIAGPSLEILKAKLDQAIAEGFLPYAATLSEYVTADEVAARYANYLDWYRTQGHFWLGTGPYYLNKVFPVEKTLMLTRNQDYVDSANKWDRFAFAPFPEVEVDGPGRVDIGSETAFDVFVTFEGEPYAADGIDEVKFLVFDATGALAKVGAAEAAGDGYYTVTLDAETTGALAAGSNKLEVIAVSKLVAIPVIGSFEFVTVAP